MENINIKTINLLDDADDEWVFIGFDRLEQTHVVWLDKIDEDGYVVAPLYLAKVNLIQGYKLNIDYILKDIDTQLLLNRLYKKIIQYLDNIDYVNTPPNKRTVSEVVFSPALKKELTTTIQLTEPIHLALDPLAQDLFETRGIATWVANGIALDGNYYRLKWETTSKNTPPNIDADVTAVNYIGLWE